MYKDCIDIWRKGITEELMNNFFMKFTYSSNKIENNETHLRDVKNIFTGLDLDSIKADKITINEIANSKKLCEQIFELTKENKPLLSLEIIKDFHKTLMTGCFREELLRKGERPGEFKKGDYVVGVHDVGCSPEEVEEELVSLIEEVNEVKITEKNALKVVSYFCAWLMNIHPFADGNGRVGRMLMNYLLIGNNLPPIILFQHDRSEYYEALEYFDDTQEIDKLVKFLEKEAYKTWEKDYSIKYKKLADFL